MLADVDERLLASLLTYLEVVRVPAFGTVVTKGEHGDSLYMVLEGGVRARVMIGGKETTLTTMGVGECFGELAIVDPGPRSADVIANQPSMLIKVSDAALRKMLAEAPALAALCPVFDPGDCPAGAGLASGTRIPFSSHGRPAQPARQPRLTTSFGTNASQRAMQTRCNV